MTKKTSCTNTIFFAFVLYIKFCVGFCRSCYEFFEQRIKKARDQIIARDKSNE